MATILADLQSWGQCAECGTNLWVEHSEHEQLCACSCGASALHNGIRVGDNWATVSDEDFQAIVDADIAVGLAP